MTKFWKYQGIGNDFIIFDQINPPTDEALIRKNVAKLCDRNFGIGGDGVILVQKSTEADYKMTVINADGSEPEMCGNGIRCMARYIYDDTQNLFTAIETIKIETLAGVKKVSMSDTDQLLTVAMGYPEIGQKRRSKITPFTFVQASMGNPHAVIVVEDVTIIELEQYGKKISSECAGGANVEFVQILDQNDVKVRVWERGAGATLACGTGACAVVAVLADQNLIKRTNIEVQLPGGSLIIDWETQNEIMMRGPAELVFEGSIKLT